MTSICVRHLAVTTALALTALLTGAAQAAPLDVDSTVQQFVPEPIIAIEAPASIASGFTIPGADGTVTITPIASSDDVPLTRSPGGRATYVEAYPATTTVFQRENDHSARILNILTGDRAPQQYSWQLILPVNTKPVAAPDGGIDIVTTTTTPPDTIAHIGKPWAFDASKKPVPTRYALDGTKLTQVVNHPNGTASYPVLAGVIWAWG
jgi:hypothetical protein